MTSHFRILNELKEWKNGEIPGCNIKLNIGDSLKSFTAKIGGPPDTPYEGGVFDVSIEIPDEYPMLPLTIKFLTKIWHPNVCHEYGDLCLNVLDEDWLPSMTMSTSLLSVQSLLESPVFTNPVNAIAAINFNVSEEMYERSVKYWTYVYANGPYTFPEFDEMVHKVREERGCTVFKALEFLSLRHWYWKCD